MRTKNFSPLFKYSVGFDRLEQLLDTAVHRQSQAPSYPPYNIESVDDDAYRITMAVAGMSEADLDITQTEHSLLITGRSQTADDNIGYVHKGIATRAFERCFDLADHVKVIDANLDNGMLTINLEREVPEALKPRQIEIRKGSAAGIADATKNPLGSEDKQAA
ncbi:MAG: Hsp20 family protein [Rhodospirillales bacterium]|nr:Hsp20 family protein [Rhodospirillales bacterium]